MKGIEMHFDKTVTLSENMTLPLWNPNGDTRKVFVPKGIYNVEGTDGMFGARLVVDGVSVKYNQL